jgi:hypothetical protein
MYAKESYADCIDDILLYLDAHADEVEDLDIEPVLEVYEAGDASGQLGIFTMRKNGELVGYAAFWRGGHPHHKGKVFAVCDLVYVTEEHRGYEALEFFRWIEENIETDVISYSLKTKHDHPELMDYLGMTCTEKVYSKVLN